MIDPLLSLVFSMHTNKGVYALLLGSGVSRAAGVPTGWDVMRDLIRKVAVLEEADAEPDPVSWYAKRFGETPGYSTLLAHLAKTQTERNQLMRLYFEPTEEEREQELKRPTRAHAAVADLVAGGHVRVILTTNFDHLMDDALRLQGIEPTVISTPDGIAGALPLAHAGVTIYKLHGDYLDTRSMNTEDELARYDPRVDALLDRVLDEFGLIVCGWSAEWDPALRVAFERCPSRRFATYWMSRGEPREAAGRIIAGRRAEIITSPAADTFFRKLAEGIAGLEEYARPHPLSTATAVANVKRYIADERFGIRLFDLVNDEVERVFGELTSATFAFQGPSPSAETFVERVRAYEGQTAMLLAMLVTGCFWSEARHAFIWQRTLSRVANQTRARSGTTVWIDLSRYPALLLLYGGGMAAIAGERYDVVKALLEARVIADEGEMTAGLVLNTWKVVPQRAVRQWLPGMERHHTPVSDHLFSLLRDPLRPFVPDDQQYTRCFDRFEYLLGLVHVDQRREMGNMRTWGPVGAFGWRHQMVEDETIMHQVTKETADAEAIWPPVSAGLFQGSMERFRETKLVFDEFVGEARRNWF